MPRGDRPVAFELTVAGGIGPAVRAALQPATSASTEWLTVLTVRLPDDEDVVGLVARLVAHGLDVESVLALT